MDTIEIDLRLKGGSVYATFEIIEPGCTLQVVEKMLCDLLDSAFDFESGPDERS